MNNQNPFEPPIVGTKTGQVSRYFRLLTLPVLLALLAATLHTVAVYRFASQKPDLTDPESGMTWLYWYALDFPISIVVFSWAPYFESEDWAVFFVAAAGGIQWAVFAFLFGLTTVLLAKLCCKWVEKFRSSRHE